MRLSKRSASNPFLNSLPISASLRSLLNACHRHVATSFSRIALCLHFHRPYQTFRLPRMTADNMDSFFPSPFHPHILYKNISRRQPRQGKVISELAAGILMRILSSGKFTQKIKTDFKTSAILKLQSIDSRECNEGIPQISLPQKGELR